MCTICIMYSAHCGCKSGSGENRKSYFSFLFSFFFFLAAKRKQKRQCWIYHPLFIVRSRATFQSVSSLCVCIFFCFHQKANVDRLLNDKPKTILLRCTPSYRHRTRNIYDRLSHLSRKHIHPCTHIYMI